MIARENRALFEGIRDRCKRTGTGVVLPTGKPIKLASNALLSYPYLFFCYEPLCPSLRDFREQLFMERFDRKSSPTPI
jgi:hypothetical protein